MFRKRCRLEGPAVAVSCAMRIERQGIGSGAAHDRGGTHRVRPLGGVDSLCLTTLYGFHSLQLSSSPPLPPVDVAARRHFHREAAAFAIVNACPKTVMATRAAARIGESSGCLP